MYCMHCGTELDKDMAYCLKCGAKVDQNSEATTEQTPFSFQDAATSIKAKILDHIPHRNDTVQEEYDNNSTDKSWIDRLRALSQSSTFRTLVIGAGILVGAGFVIWLLFLFLRWMFSSFILTIVVIAGGYIVYHKGIAEIITEHFYKKESKQLQLPEGMSASMLLEALSGKFNYPYFKGIHYGTEGECIIEGKYSMYPIIFDQDNIAEISYISKENNKKKRTVLLEAMAIRDYINKFFNPNLSVDVVKDMKKLRLAEGQRKAASFVSAAASLLIIAAIIWDYIVPGSLLEIALPGMEVRGAYLSQYSKSVTIEEAFDHFFDNGKWSKYDSEGYTNIVFTGSCNYQGQRSDIRIIFKITGENFIVDSLDINGQSQNGIVLRSLMSTVYEDY